MKDIFKNYMQSIAIKFSQAETTEMGYRTDFEILLRQVFESIKVKRIDHDARAQQGNKPDFVVLKFDVPILYIETKKIGTSLDKIEQSEQMARYYGYANLILTDYVEFRFYRNGIRYEEPILLAHYQLKKRILIPIMENYERLGRTLIDFAQTHREPIRSGKHLAKIMGGKAQRIRDNMKQFMSVESEKSTEINRVFQTIKKLLVHDLTLESFADMYAQTLVYGLFVARYHDDAPESFSRQKARDLVPASNPLLRHFFDHIVGPDFDKRLEYIVNELCEIFLHANVQELMKEYYQNGLAIEARDLPDPVIHFYEDFLKEYDPELRKKLGAYYTPLPVVRFIVRAVDYLLEKEFGLAAGLADTSRTEKGLHKLHILDPAVGTGTFISAVIRAIYSRLLKTGQKGRWPAYVHNDLLPRLHGFELMMAPYTIAHLKLSMAFKETGFWSFHRRLGIYLTNALEETVVQKDLFTGFGFSESIAEESKQAAIIKNEIPIMIVIGNPPYSVSSSNKSEWIQNLIKVYKTGLQEKNIQPLSDDYIKFIRFAEHFIEKNKSGIVGIITNNSFLEGIIHRQMRKHLLKTFDDIYIIDLHGNAKKIEKDASGESDENIFVIQQGVAISIFIRKVKKKKELANVYHTELLGKREMKFTALNENGLNTIKWSNLKCVEPYYFFSPKDFSLENEYNTGFKIDELFHTYSSGITTFKDDFLIDFTEDALERKKADLFEYSENQISVKYDLKNTRDFKLHNVISDLPNSSIRNILYRPFDIRKVIYSRKTKGVLAYPRYEVMQHLLKPNIALLTCRQQTSFDFQHIFISGIISERCSVSLQTGELTYVFPCYVYSSDDSRKPNLKQEFLDTLEWLVGKVSPEDVFDYIYAVLHSPRYRATYKEFLKIDFPRIPYPKDEAGFRKLVAFGAELRLLHLLESPKVSQFITTFPLDGSDVVEKVEYKDGAVFINSKQFFGNVPESTWNFYVGGYQPAQKWLKDRRNRKLSNFELEHYQKIIVALVETEKIMKQIDAVIDF